MCCPHKSQAQCSHSFLAKDKQKNSKYYITQYYYLGVFVNVCTLCQLINLIFHGVQKLCRSIIEPEWSTRVTCNLLYITLFCLFVCCCYCLFVVCVMHFVITSSLYCYMCAILHKKNSLWQKISLLLINNCVFICFLFMFFFFYFIYFFFPLSSLFCI